MKPDIHIKTEEPNFLGTPWSFVVAEDGRAYWRCPAKVFVESSRNGSLKTGIMADDEEKTA